MNWYKKAQSQDQTGRGGLIGPVWHGTLSDFSSQEWKLEGLGIHFGTREQAEDRVGNNQDAGWEGGPRYIQAYLDIKNPLRMGDGYWNDPQEMIDDLIGLGISVPPEWDQWVNNPSDSSQPDDKTKLVLIREFLQSLGYDGIIYLNDGEISGQVWQDSYIVFDKDHIVFSQTEG